MSSRKIKDGVQIWTQLISEPIACLDFSPRESLVGIGFEDGRVQMLDAFGNLLWEVQASKRSINDLKIVDSKKCLTVLVDDGRLKKFNFSGALKWEKKFDPKWTGLEAKSNGYYLWHWNSPVLALNGSGKKLKEIPLPLPLRKLKFLPKYGGFFVVHNPLSVGVYNSRGVNQWCANHPVQIQLSRDINSDVDVGDYGKTLAICCFEKGAYIYNGLEATLKNMELENPMSHLAVSRDGRRLLFTDTLGGVYLVSRDVQILWQGSLEAPPLLCKLNGDGTQALIYDERGGLSCFRFFEGDEDRNQFFDLGNYKDTITKQAIWKKEIGEKHRPPGGLLKISPDGRWFLYGLTKDFYLIDSQGNLVWEKSFLNRFRQSWFINNGDTIVLANDNIVYLYNLKSGIEKRFTFFKMGLREIALHPLGDKFLTHCRDGFLSLHTAEGKTLWKRSIKQKIGAMRIGLEGKAVLNGVGRALYLLDLEDFKARKVTLDDSFSQICLDASGLYVGSVGGQCYALDLEGNIKWKRSVGQKIVSIACLNQKAVFVGREKRAFLFDAAGNPVSEGALQNAHSILNDCSDDILEIVPQRRTISCYKLFGEQPLWTAAFQTGVDLSDVCESGNRMTVLDASHFYFFDLVPDVERIQDRASFLEL